MFAPDASLLFSGVRPGHEKILSVGRKEPPGRNLDIAASAASHRCGKKGLGAAHYSLAGLCRLAGVGRTRSFCNTCS